MTSKKVEKTMPTAANMTAAGFYNTVEAERYQRKLAEEFQAVMKSSFPNTFKALDWTGLSEIENGNDRYTIMRGACGSIYHSLLHTARVTVEVYKEAARSGVARDAKVLVTLAALFHDYKHGRGGCSEEINIFNAMAPFVLCGAENGIVVDGRFISKHDLCVDIYGTSDPDAIGTAYADFMNSVAQIIGETYYPYRRTHSGSGSNIVRKADVAGMLRPDWYETTFLGLHCELKYRNDEDSVMKFIEQQMTFARTMFQDGDLDTVVGRLQAVATCMMGSAGWLAIPPDRLSRLPIYIQDVHNATILEQHYSMLEGRFEREGTAYGQFTLATGAYMEMILPPLIANARPGDYIYFTEQGRLEDDQQAVHRKVASAFAASGIAGSCT